MINQLTSIALVLVATSLCPTEGQFLPQSHLGRLVQSITSPLVLSSGSSTNQDDGDSSNHADPASYYYSGVNSESGSQDAASGPSRQPSHYPGHQQALQQAPSQQRGVPQHYYTNPQDIEHGGAPSNNKHQQEYQMGAYLGPSMDDKEINGAFNNPNDDRDDDDSAANYDEPTQRGRAHEASNIYQNQGDYSEPSSHSSYQRDHSARSAANPGYGPNQSDGYDEDSADEDDGPAHSGRAERAKQPYYRGQLNQAASQYQQQGYGRDSNGPQNMMTAANGYAPYGYANGPVDLTGIMAGLSGDPNSGYQAYNGDGSYPGANYYQQQGRGGRQRSASMQNGYGYGQDSDGQQNSNRNKNNNNSNNDDHDSDADED